MKSDKLHFLQQLATHSILAAAVEKERSSIFKRVLFIQRFIV
jgi:hypothetical protein